MLHRASNPPSGSRGSRSFNSTRPAPRGPSGGIQKRSSGTTRADRDGDLDMDASGSGRGQGRGRGRGHGHGRGRETAQTERPRDATRSGQPRSRVDISALQKAITRGISAGNAVTRSRGAISVSGMLKEAAGRRSGLDEVSVRGWRESRASTNSGGGIKELIDFLERKATPASAPIHEKVRIQKSRTRGDALIVSVNQEDTSKILRLDAYSFAGAPLKIEKLATNPEPVVSPEAAELKQKITTMLNRRYNAELKLLDLSALGTDPEFATTGMFETHSRQAKFFPAIMKVCDSLFTSFEQKRVAIISVTLANNGLPNVTTVTTLAQTFPDIKNLDLSNNSMKDLDALEAWRHKFRHLDHLILSGNPLESAVPNYQADVLQWWPTLRTLNTIQVRSDADVAAALASKSALPLPILPASFHDEATIGEDFLKHFFPAYDADRSALVTAFYDAESSFSLSVNISAPRAIEVGERKTPTWEAYIKKSRNLTKITNLPTRMSRLAKGTEAIREVWLTLPTTRHPDLFAESQKWCIECHSIPCLPDPSGQSGSGVGGLLVMAHSEFSEVDVSTGNVVFTRSFDRTFVLGPGAGVGGVRVINDVLVVRAYGGHDAWKPTELPAPIESSPPEALSTGLQVPEGFGTAMPGKSDDLLQKELLALQLSNATRMTLEFSGLCLEQSGWNIENAAKTFEAAKANLPIGAYF